MYQRIKTWLKGNPAPVNIMNGETCKGCNKVIASPMGVVPYFEADGKENGHLCAYCVNTLKSLGATASFNYHQYKTAQLIRVVIDPRDLPPEFLAMFQDEDSVQDFLESLSEYECSIIQKHRDNPNILRQIYEDVVSDLEDTSKDLAME